KALLGRACLDDDLPYVTGPIGLLGSRPSWMMMNECDTLLVVGSSFPYSEFLPKEGQARGVQIDLKPEMLSIRYPMEVNLVGDSAETLRELIPLLDRKRERDGRAGIEQEIEEWWEIVEERALLDADPINPQRVFHELSPRLPDDVLLAADSGSAANWWARNLRMKPTMLASLSGNLATMGPGVPYVIAGKFCHPSRPAVAMVGGGAMQMNGINGLITIAKYWRRWGDPRLVVGVLSNTELNQVTWEQRALSGDPEYEPSQDVPSMDFAEYARELGLRGVRVDDPARIGSAWDEAFAADRPTVIDFVTDPSVPPLPPHITFDQARNYLTSMLKGDPHRWSVLKQSVRHVVGSVRP